MKLGSITYLRSHLKKYSVKRLIEKGRMVGEWDERKRKIERMLLLPP